MRAENNLIALLVAIHDFLEGIKDVHIESILADWPSANCIKRSVLPHRLPVLSWLPAAVKAAGKNTEGIVKMLAAQANRIAWGQTYSAQDFGVGFLEKYGWTELIGLRGPIASDRIACGFLFLGPQIEYPRHRHEAEEVYVPLTGQTLWQRHNRKWAYRAAGLPIYHAPRMPHAMRTETVPLLALYLWRGGNLVQKSLIG
jgi:hypothetical protein